MILFFEKLTSKEVKIRRLIQKYGIIKPSIYFVEGSRNSAPAYAEQIVPKDYPQAVSKARAECVGVTEAIYSKYMADSSLERSLQSYFRDDNAVFALKKLLAGWVESHLFLLFSASELADGKDFAFVPKSLANYFYYKNF